MTAKPEEHTLRAWWLCEPAGECSSCTHTGLHLSVMPDHRAPMPKHADETVHPLSDWLASKPEAETKVTLAPTAEVSFKELPTPTGNVCLLVGAEGGLTENEIALAASQGFTPVRLGKRILRTETAPLAAIATMQTIWGDFCV